jgi:CheY-like chemotaxis protein
MEERMDNLSPARHVLIVEDDLDTGRLFVELLESYGYAVRLVHTGREAVQAIRASEPRPQAVLLDFDLPDMTAREVLRATTTHRADLPVVLVTASGHAEQLGRDLNVYCVVAKPFAVSVLLDTLAACIASA